MLNCDPLSKSEYPLPSMNPEENIAKTRGEGFSMQCLCINYSEV